MTLFNRRYKLSKAIAIAIAEAEAIAIAMAKAEAIAIAMAKAFGKVF